MQCNQHNFHTQATFRAAVPGLPTALLGAPGPPALPLGTAIVSLSRRACYELMPAGTGQTPMRSDTGPDRRCCGLRLGTGAGAQGAPWGKLISVESIVHRSGQRGLDSSSPTVTQTPEEPVDEEGLGYTQAHYSGEQPFSFCGGEPSALVKGLQRNRTIRISRERILCISHLCR